MRTNIQQYMEMYTDYILFGISRESIMGKIHISVSD